MSVRRASAGFALNLDRSFNGSRSGASLILSPLPLPSFLTALASALSAKTTSSRLYRVWAVLTLLSLPVMG
ncbi:hypothetical protein JHK87_014817 [Glycine soja]|nr:hypothetical protein JHK87_014817 [Glycine soja]